MAGVQRSPTTPRAQLPNLTQTQSEPDITSAVTVSEYVTSRNKRPRIENSQPSGDSPNQHEHQVTGFCKKLEEQTSLMAKLVADVREIKAQNVKIQESNAEICKTNTEIERSMSFMNKNFEELRKEVEELKKERLEQRCYIETLEKKIADLKFKSRSAGIEIRNIPQTDTENSSDLVKTVCSIGKLVGVPISEPELRDTYRLPGKPTSAATTRPIIAEFSCVQTKQKILSAVRTYNNKSKLKDNKLNTELIGIAGKRQPVYVAEQLPASSKKLFYMAREFAKNNQYAFCWINNGNIFLRKKTGDNQLLINSEKSLQGLGMNNI